MLGRLVGLGTHHRLAMGSDCVLRGVLCARGNFLPRYVFYLSLVCYLAIGARFGFLLGLNFLDDETYYFFTPGMVWKMDPYAMPGRFCIGKSSSFALLALCVVRGITNLTFRHLTISTIHLDSTWDVHHDQYRLHVLVHDEPDRSEAQDVGEL